MDTSEKEVELCNMDSDIELGKKDKGIKIPITPVLPINEDSTIDNVVNITIVNSEGKKILPHRRFSLPQNHRDFSLPPTASKLRASRRMET